MSVSDSKKTPKANPKAPRKPSTTPARGAKARKRDDDQPTGASLGGGRAARPRLRASHTEVTTRGRRKDGPAERKPTRAAPKARPSLGAPTPGRAMPPAPVRARSEAKPIAKTKPEPTSRARELALAIAEAGLDKKAVGVEIIDVTGRVEYADFLVLMTGRGDRHVKAIAEGIDEALSRRSSSPISVEGLQTCTWVLLDFGDVVAHVFQEDARKVYDIEGLWMDERRVEVPHADRS